MTDLPTKEAVPELTPEQLEAITYQNAAEKADEAVMRCLRILAGTKDFHTPRGMIGLLSGGITACVRYSVEYLASPMQVLTVRDLMTKIIPAVNGAATAIIAQRNAPPEDKLMPNAGAVKAQREAAWEVYKARIEEISGEAISWKGLAGLAWRQNFDEGRTSDADIRRALGRPEDGEG